jgi:uncharacterized membrane protein YeaQ/YmgE (transglycosylase-associated protein family)
LSNAPSGEHRTHAHNLDDHHLGSIAGVIAKLITRGDNEPQGFILTTILGIVGAFVATYLEQAEDQAAGLIGATIGAVLILLVWGFIERRKQTT